MSSLEEIRASTEVRIADARREISSLETARSALRSDRVTVPRAARSRAGGSGADPRGSKSRKAARPAKRQERVGEPAASAVPGVERRLSTPCRRTAQAATTPREGEGEGAGVGGSVGGGKA